MEDNYRRYQEARDTAWRALLRLENKRLPVDPEALARQVGLDPSPYPQSDREPRLYALTQKAGGGACVSLRIRGKWHLFLRESAGDDPARRFMIAHELGHLLLRHKTYVLSPGVLAFRGGENAGDLIENPESADDRDADIFAIRLLAPACLLHEMHVDTAGGIRRLCGLPPRAAAMRAERMELLSERDAFYTHALERQVRAAFLPYLRERASLPPPALAAAEKTPLVLPLDRLNPPTEPAPAEAPAPDAPLDRKASRLLLPLAVLGAALLLFFLLWLFPAGK